MPKTDAEKIRGILDEFDLADIRRALTDMRLLPTAIEPADAPLTTRLVIGLRSRVVLPLDDGPSPAQLERFVLRSAEHIKRVDEIQQEYTTGTDLSHQRISAVYDGIVRHLNQIHSYFAAANIAPFDPLTGDRYFADPLPTMRELAAIEAEMRIDPAPLRTPAADDKDTGKTIVFKVLGVLGVGDVAESIWEILEADYEDLVKGIGDDFKNKRWTSLKDKLKRLLQIMTSDAFVKKLGRKIGEKGAARIVGKILARYAPVLGWAIFIGSVILAIIENV